MELRSRIDVHRVVFWGSLAAAGIFLAASAASNGGPFPTIFDPVNREIVRRGIYRSLGWPSPSRTRFYHAPPPPRVHAH